MFIAIDNSLSHSLVWNNYAWITSSTYNDHTLINREAPNDNELAALNAAAQPLLWEQSQDNRKEANDCFDAYGAGTKTCY